jgi:beta-lactamase superfamily II metal-dependent hydrolase
MGDCMNKKIRIYKRIVAIVLCMSMIWGMSISSSAAVVGRGASNSIRTAASSSPGAVTNMLGGATIYMPSNQSASQMESFLITTADGQLIVIDGGTAADEPYLKALIMQRGGHVSAWFLTHAHADHVGAITRMINEDLVGVTIDNIYYNFPSIDFFRIYDSTRADTAKACMDALAKMPAQVLHSNVSKGDIINIGDVRVEVMNTAYQLETDSGNNSSVVYKFTINGKKIIFLGDLGYEGGKKFLEENADVDLKCDIVQLAHHGQNGVDKEVYEKMRPTVALWCTPDWLWRNDNGGGDNSGPWDTITVRNWMQSLGVRYNFCIKDGNQTIN